MAAELDLPAETARPSRHAGAGVAAVAVGGLIGWQCDRWFHTSPFLLILFLALGTAAGFWTVYRLAWKATDGFGQR